METFTKRPRAYSPALGLPWLLPLYDPLVRAVVPEEALKRTLVRLADIRRGDRVLDLGCGTATLTLFLAAMHPTAQIVGLDADVQAIARARAKAAAVDAPIRFSTGSATALPYASASLDRVLCAFVFHHLSSEQKRETVREVLRVLRTGGTFALLDFGRPVTRLGVWLAHLLHPGRNARDNIRGRLPQVLREVGFDDVREAARRTLVVGSVSYWLARKA